MYLQCISARWARPLNCAVIASSEPGKRWTIQKSLGVAPSLRVINSVKVLVDRSGTAPFVWGAAAELAW
jgi:hypothetical protein